MREKKNKQTHNAPKLAISDRVQTSRLGLSIPQWGGKKKEKKKKKGEKRAVANSTEGGYFSP